MRKNEKKLAHLTDELSPMSAELEAAITEATELREKLEATENQIAQIMRKERLAQKAGI